MRSQPWRIRALGRVQGQLSAVRDSIASVSNGKQVNQDAWMSMWCNTNWGDLLQPAPLSIALLGSILIIASSTDDFSLVSDAPPNCPPFNWEYAKQPNSFKTCLQQMVGDGYTAYEAAHKNMESIQNTAGQVPDVIRTVVELITQATAQEINANLPNTIDDLVQLSKRCSSAAKDTEDKFKDLAGLAQEMVLACTYKAGTDEQAINQNAINLAVLKVQKEQEDKTVKDAKDMADFMKKSYTKAEDAFYQAVNNVPSGWDLVGMQTVQSLTGLVVSAGNAYISQVTLRSQAASAGIGAFRHLDGEDDSDNKDKAINAANTIPTVKPSSKLGVSTQPNTATLTDSGTLMVQHVLDQVNNIKALLVGADGKPDWDKIRTKKDTDKTGATYVESSLQSLKSQLEPEKPISVQLTPIIEEALKIVAKIIEAGGDIGAKEDALADQVELVDNLISQLNALIASVNLVLQQPGNVANGPATPQTPQDSGNNSAAQLAVQNAKYMVDQTRSQLEATRDSYEKAADRLVDQQKEITKTIGKMTELKLANVTLQQLLPVLKKAVGAFTTLRAQLSQLVQFFDSVASLLIDVMAPSVDRWVKTIEAAEQQITNGEQPPTLGGVNVSAFTRDLIYRQMMMPIKVATLAVQISQVYMEISTNYIMPAQRQVGSMLQFNDGDPNFKTQLARAQKHLADTTTQTSDQISEIVSKDQKKFLSKIDNRLAQIMQAVQPVLPDADARLPPPVEDVKKSHTADFDKLKKKEAAQNPMFNPDDAV